MAKDDLISRAATAERMVDMAGCGICQHYGHVKCRACSWDDAMNIVDEMPAVDAVPVVRGRWTERHVDYVSDCAIDEVQTAKCSVCGLYHTTPYLYSFTDYKFCPNCGARMDGELDG